MGGTGFVNAPLNGSEVQNFKKELKLLLDDPYGMADQIDPFLGPQLYTWVELMATLGILFSGEERVALLSLVPPLEEGEGRRGENSSVSGWQRQGKKQQRGEREGERQEETETKRESERERKKETERETKRESKREREKERDRKSKRERDRSSKEKTAYPIPLKARIN